MGKVPIWVMMLSKYTSSNSDIKNEESTGILAELLAGALFSNEE